MLFSYYWCLIINNSAYIIMNVENNVFAYYFCGKGATFRMIG